LVMYDHEFRHRGQSSFHVVHPILARPCSILPTGATAPNYRSLQLP
jgi:hypothetical protein